MLKGGRIIIAKIYPRSSIREFRYRKGLTTLRSVIAINANLTKGVAKVARDALSIPSQLRATLQQVCDDLGQVTIQAEAFSELGEVIRVSVIVAVEVED